MSVGLLTTLRRRWRIALPLGVGFGWVMAGPLSGVPLVLRYQPEQASGITLPAMVGSMVGCALGGLLWARRPDAAPLGGRWSLAGAGLIGLLLPLFGGASAAPLVLIMTALFGVWVVAVGIAYVQQVPAAERGRTMGWMGFFVYLVIQLVAWLSPVLPSPWLWAGMAGLLVIPIAAAPGPPDPSQVRKEGSREDEGWYRLFPFILFAFTLAGQMRAIGDGSLPHAQEVTRHLDLLLYAPASLLIGLAVDRGKMVQVASGAVLVMGVGYGLQSALPGPPGALALQEGTRLGIAMLGVFWWHQMAALAGRMGPAAAIAAGNLMELSGLLVGAMISPVIPPPVLGGMTVMALLAGMMLVSRLPDSTAGSPGPAAAASGHARVDLAEVLGEVVQAPLTAREQEVSRLLLEGHSTAEIAGALYLSENTVRTHLKNIYRKADCGSRQELMSRLLERVAGGQAK